MKSSRQIETNKAAFIKILNYEQEVFFSFFVYWWQKSRTGVDQTFNNKEYF